MVILKERPGVLLGGVGMGSKVGNFLDKAEGVDKNRDCINLLYKRNLLACEKSKQACLF